RRERASPWTSRGLMRNEELCGWMRKRPRADSNRRIAVLQTAHESPQLADLRSTSATDAERLVSCLAFLSRVSPDLAFIVERWGELPGTLRTGIIAMIRASG